MSDSGDDDLVKGAHPTTQPNELSGSMGGADADVPYHPLALDVEEGDVWGKIDLASRRVGEWFNPILVKEARQSLKSRQIGMGYKRHMSYSS